MNTDNYTRKGKVINVVDGDTIDVAVDLGFYTTVNQRFRLLRINCPEMTGESHAEGQKAKDFTTKNLLNKEVVLKSEKTDSFRRWLAEVWYIDDTGGQVNISDKLLKNGLAVDFIK